MAVNHILRILVAGAIFEEHWSEAMANTKRRNSKEEFARRGDAIYEKEIRPMLKPADEGKFTAIDIETGAFAIAADELKAGNKLLKRVPDAQIWMVRVGHRAVHRIGGRASPREGCPSVAIR